MTREEAIHELQEDKMLYETEVCHAGDGSPDGRLLEALDMAIFALTHDIHTETHECVKETHDTDLISRADAINAVHKYFVDLFNDEPYETDEDGDEVFTDMKSVNALLKHNKAVSKAIKALPSAELPLTKLKQEFESADAVSRYAEWLEKIIVDAETLEWLCEDTPCKEWCDENCHYKSIQAECLRHLYEVSKGGDDE